MKLCKKLVLCLLAVTMVLLCLAAFPQPAQAATVEDLKFELDTDGTGYIVVGYNKDAGGELVIPGNYNGKPVVAIGRGAFAHWSTLTSLVLSDNITTVEADAFKNCNNLTSITLGIGFEMLGQNAFEGCDNLVELKVKEGNRRYHSAGNCIIGTEAKTLVKGCKSSQIPNDGSVTKIANLAFVKCVGLTSITIPDCITVIGANAFSGCTNLTEIVLPDSVTQVGDKAFNECSSLTEITIPDSVAEIGESAFRYCTSLSSVTLSNSLFVIPKDLFIYCSSLTEITIPDSVKWIETNAFFGTGLTHLTIPDSVTTIMSPILSNCYDLVSVHLGKGITSIDNNEFLNCTNLTTITVTENLVHIGMDALRDNPINFSTYDNGKYVGDEQNPYMILVAPISQSITSCEVHPDTKVIATYALDECRKLASITMSEGVETIGKGAFQYCDSLTEVVIPDSVTTLGGDLFFWCKNLTSIIFGDGVTRIHNDMFEQCNALSHVTLGNGIININKEALPSNLENYTEYGNCKYLGNEENPYLVLMAPDKYLKSCQIHPDTKVIAGHAFDGYITLTDISIPDGLTAIGDYAFYKCKELPSITIPDGVTYIGNYAFHNCEKLVNVRIPNSVTYIGDYAFAHCYGFTHVTVPDSVTYLGRGAFHFCKKLVGITLSENITSIGENTFCDCASLTSITIPDSVTSIGKEAFAACTSLTSAIIGDGVTIIETHAFYQCTALNNIRVPGSVTRIDGSTFEECASLKNVTLEKGISKIPADMFRNCTNLSSITIPETVTSIGMHAFSGCNRLATVTFCGTPAQWNAVQIGGNDEKPLGNAKIQYHNYANGVCTICRHCKESTWTYRLSNYEELAQESVVYVNGLPYEVKADGEGRYVELPQAEELLLVTYTYHEGDGQDVHTQYPTGMKVYLVKDGKITHIPELDNLLQYSGASIRITGKKGIRMITSIEKAKKTALTGKGLAGYTLVEYGTTLCFANEIPEGDALVLDRSYARSNYAYKKGVADPVFATTKDLVQYTNVLVGFSLDQCKDDIAMRPYIILKNAEGEQFTIYGGTIYRSIGYIAYQNRSVFQPKTGSYNYVWEIIHHVYGNKYDADYKG